MAWHLKRKHKIIVETIARSNDPDRFKCCHCAKVFPTSLRLKDHVNTHTGMYFDCLNCMNWAYFLKAYFLHSCMSIGTIFLKNSSAGSKHSMLGILEIVWII